MWSKLKACYKEFGCWDKNGISAAVSAGIQQLFEAQAGGQEVQTNGEVVGWIPAGNGNFDGNEGGSAIWGYSNYDSGTYGVVPNIDPVQGHNPQCDGDGVTIGTLVIDPALPANTTASTFDLTFEILDNSGGLGAMFAFCPATGEMTALQGVGGSLGNNTAPVTFTRRFDISSLPCAPDAVRVGFNAWGVSGSFGGDRCDSLNPLTETLVVVAPSKLAAAEECFAQLFCGFSFDDLLTSSSKIASVTRAVYRTVDDAAAVNWELWIGAQSAPHDSIDVVFGGPADLWGTPGHVNGEPSISGTHATMDFSDLQLIGDPDAAEGNQQLRAWGYKRIPADGFIRENNGNIGERGRFYCGIPGTCPTQLQVLAERDTDTTTAERGLFGPIAVSAGEMVPWLLLMSDLSAYFGFDLEFSENGVDGWTAIESFASCGEEERYELPICQTLQDDESLFATQHCKPDPILISTQTQNRRVVGELEGVDGPLNMNPATLTPITWGGWQSQDNAVVQVDGTQAELLVPVKSAHVVGSVTVKNEGNASNAQRAHPELWLMRNGQRWALAQSYVRDVNGHDSDTLTVSRYDMNPVAGTTYSLSIIADSIDTAGTGQANAALEADFDNELASYLQVATTL